MQTVVRFEFDDNSFVPASAFLPISVKLIDPPHIPSTGDIVHIRMEEFFEDPDLISNFEEQSDGVAYYAERVNTIIGKNDIEIIIALYKEEVFKRKDF